MRVGLYSDIANLAVASDEDDRLIVLSTKVSINLHLFVIHVGGNEEVYLFKCTLLLQMTHRHTFDIIWVQLY